MKKYFSIILCLVFSFSLFAQDEDEAGGKLGEAAAAMHNKRFREAEEIYRALLKKSPDDISVKQLLCHALISEKKYLEVDSMLRRMLEEDSNNAGNYWYMGMSSVSQGKDSVAIENYKYYLKKTEDNPNQKVKAWLYIGSAYRRLMHSRGISKSECEDMLYHYKRYLVLNPHDAFGGELQKFIDAVAPKIPAEGAILIWDETN